MTLSSAMAALAGAQAGPVVDGLVDSGGTAAGWLGAGDLPALLVVIPLLGAPLCLSLVIFIEWLFGRRGGSRAGHLARRWPTCCSASAVSWAMSVLVSAAAFIIALLLLQQSLTVGTVSYALGGWAAPLGIEYRVDPLAGFVLVLVAGMGLLVLAGTRLSVEREIALRLRPLFYTAFLLCLSGLLGIVISGDAFNVFVFLEISSLATYSLVALGGDRRALTAAFRYLIIGTIGATFILIAVGLLYMMTGTLNMLDLAARLPAVAETRTVHTAFAFLTIGVGIKLALFPFHLWLPAAYTYAPSAVTAFLAATATKVALYVLLRFCYTVFGAEFSFTVMPLATILLVLGMAAALSASTVAIFQGNVKRMLAYSSIAQIGYMAVGIGLANATGLMAAVLHLFNHALMKGALFLALGAVVYRVGGFRLDDLRGLGARMPWTAAVLVVGGLGLIGVPLTVGFVSKWYLLIAALERGWWPVAALIVFASLLAVAYVWRLVEALYFSAPVNTGAGDTSPTEAPMSLLLPALLLAAASVVFGIYSAPLVDVATAAAQQLMFGATLPGGGG